MSCPFVFLFGQLVRTQAQAIVEDAKGNVTSIDFAGAEKIPADHLEFFKMYVKTTALDQFRAVNDNIRSSRERHERYDLYHNNVQVEGAGYVLHYQDGYLKFVQGHYVNAEGVAKSPVTNPDIAIPGKSLPTGT